MADETMKKKREEFTEKVNKAFGDSFKYEYFATDPELADLDTPTFPAYADDDDGEMPPIPEADDEPDADTYDQYIGAEVTLPIGDKMLSAKVRRRKRTIDGSLTGKAHQYPILNTRTYNVEFADGQTAELSANVIAQNMYVMCDTEGNQYILLKESLITGRTAGPLWNARTCTFNEDQTATSAKQRKGGRSALSGRTAVPHGNG